jgi:hypothetical protein
VVWAVLVVPVVSEVWVVRVVPVVSEVWVVRVVQVALVAQVELAASAVLAAWVVVLGRRNYPPVAPVAIGSTTRRIAVALPMGIAQLRPDLVVRLGEPRWLIVRRAQGSRLVDRAAM